MISWQEWFDEYEMLAAQFNVGMPLNLDYEKQMWRDGLTPSDVLFNERVLVEYKSELPEWAIAYNTLKNQRAA